MSGTRLDQCVLNALDDIESESLYEYQFLFTLVGHLRGLEPGQRQSDRRTAQKYIPTAHTFAAEILERDLSKGFIDWEDRDAVALEFVKAWTSRRLPKQTDIFERAIRLSAHNPLLLDDEMNRWVIRIVNLAFCLSEMLPDTPTLIPISTKTAEMLGTSLRTLSLAMQESVREKYILVIEKADQSLPVRKARRLKFNTKHPKVTNHIDGSRKRLRELIQTDTPSQVIEE